MSTRKIAKIQLFFLAVDASLAAETNQVYNNETLNKYHISKFSYTKSANR
jgi:hypothetical protein